MDAGVRHAGVILIEEQVMGCGAAMRVLIVGVVLSVRGAAVGEQTAPGAPAPGAPADGAAPMAVVEVFTSEGCSHCTTGEMIFALLLQNAEATARPIYLMSFHVDIWDPLGWKDPFAEEAHVARQREYSGGFKPPVDGVYTPMMVVNGREHFQATNKAQADTSINAALKRPGAAEVAIDVRWGGGSGGSLLIDYVVTPAGAGSVPAGGAGTVLHVALLEDDLRSHVTAGENKGKILHHDNVVRRFVTVPLPESGEGQVEIAAPAGVKLEKSSLVVYAQAGATGPVLGATEGAIPPVPSAGPEPVGETGEGGTK